MTNNQHDISTSSREWTSKPKYAKALRFGLGLLPPATAVVSSIVFSHIVREPRTGILIALWLVSLLSLSTLVLILVERQTRRFLPLVALLKLTMVFPDQAPSRFRAAIRAGSLRKLEERVSAVGSDAWSGLEPTNAAVSIIELVTALTYHDRRTRGHAERVKAYALLLGQECGLSSSDCNKLMWSALLHDVGKVTVSEGILNKKGAPSREEWEIIKRHPFEGKRLLEPLQEWMGPFANAAWEHHEKWNGEGYPLGLSGHEISLAGRIVALADAFEVMTATRSYKKPMSITEAREEVVRCAGTHFDPEMVRALLNISLGRLRLVAGPAAWIAQLPFLGWTAPVGIPAAINTVGGTMALVSFVHGVAPSALPTHATQSNNLSAPAIATTSPANRPASAASPIDSAATPAAAAGQVPASSYSGIGNSVSTRSTHLGSGRSHSADGSPWSPRSNSVPSSAKFTHGRHAGSTSTSSAPDTPGNSSNVHVPTTPSANPNALAAQGNSPNGQPIAPTSPASQTSTSSAPDTPGNSSNVHVPTTPSAKSNAP